MDPLNAILNFGLDNPTSSQSLSLLVKNLLANRFPSPEIVTLPEAFMRKAGLAISQTNTDGRERGFTLLANDKSQLMIPDEKRWSIGDNKSVSVQPFNEAGIKDIGVFHTHPYQQQFGAKSALAFSEMDVISFLNTPRDRFSIVGAPDGTFLMMVKTLDTPLSCNDPLSVLFGRGSAVDPASQIKLIYENAKQQFAHLIGLNWINMAHVQVQKQFGLIFYQTEARETRNDPISPVLLKVDLKDGGFASKK